MEDIPSVMQEVIRDEPPMAAPPDCFPTHDCAPTLTAQFGQAREADAKLVGQRVVRVIVEALVGPEAIDFGGTVFDFFRRPPSSSIRVWPICQAASASGRASRLYCGLVRDRGVLRMSTTISTLPVFNSSTNSTMLRVE